MPLTAKYATSCGVCRSAINPGDEIVSLPSGGARWAHAKCSGEQAALDLGETTASRANGHDTGQTASPSRTSSPSDQDASSSLEVYTDGACSGNPGPGGWAWATRDGRQGSGGASPTTNQRMEIQAALEAVRSLPDSPLTVVSDSTYVVNCFRDGWWQGWLSRNWQTSAKKPVANRDLWEPLIELVQKRGDVTFRWVKGHSGDSMNDLVDGLAVAESKKQQQT